MEQFYSIFLLSSNLIASQNIPPPGSTFSVPLFQSAPSFIVYTPLVFTQQWCMLIYPCKHNGRGSKAQKVMTKKALLSERHRGKRSLITYKKKTVVLIRDK